MCTLITLHGCAPGAWLVVAANRDEWRDRPAEPPALRETHAGTVLAPRDVSAGGTWLGLGPQGLFAAVTNRAGQPPDPARRSRGLLVMDVLGAESARAAARALAALPPRAYNPFNLFVADAREAFAVAYEEKPRLMPLRPGVHVIGNGELDHRDRKAARLRARVEPLAGAPRDALLDGLGEVCRSHEGARDSLENACIHGPAYGTRSSTLLWLGATSGVLRHAEGPPCEASYRDLSPLLDRLGRAAEREPEDLPARGVR